MKFDFAKNQHVDSLQGVPEDFRGLYAESADGGFDLRSEDDGVKSAISAITRMTGALHAARNEAKTAKSNATVDLSPLSDYGQDPQEMATNIASKIDELQTQLAASKGKKSADEVQQTIERMKNDLMGTHQTEIQKRDEQLESLRKHLFKTLVSDAATREIASAGGDPEMLMPFVAPSLAPFENDGEYSVRVVDDHGEIRYNGATGETMTIADRVAELKGNAKFGKLFESDAPSGGGMLPNAARRSPQTPAPADMSPTQKIAAGLAKGQAIRAGAGDRAGAGVL